MRLTVIGLAGIVVAAFACGGSGSDGSGSSDGGSDATSSSSGGSSGGGSGGGSGGSSGGSGGSSGSGSGSSSGGKDGGSGSSSGGTDAGPPVGASVVTFHNHVNRDGSFVDAKITKAAAPNFHLITTFSAKTTGHVYASPLYVENGPAGKGTFYVATESNVVTAFDETTGAQVWSKTIATPAQNTGAGCGNIGPIGITGTPAIDLASRTMIFDAVHADGSQNIGSHVIHAISIDDGSPKWSVDVSTLQDGTGLKFSDAVQAQNERGAVLIVGGAAFVVFGGHYGDCGAYHGWVVRVKLDGTGAKAWATQVGGAGIWGVGGAASDGQSVFVTTGNGIGGPASWAESEGVFRFDTMLGYTGQTADYFAPYDWQNLDQGDVDLSGSGPLVVDAPGLTPSALVVAQGKDGWLYLMDRANLGGIATMAQRANVGALQVQSGEITNGAAWATISGSTYVVVRPNGTDQGVGCGSGNGDLVAVKLQNMSVAWCANSGGIGSPSITTSDGTNDALVWTFQADQNPGKLMAFDLATGATVFNGGGSANAVSGVRRFTTPIAVHGRIYVGGDGQLFAFGAQ